MFCRQATMDDFDLYEESLPSSIRLDEEIKGLIGENRIQEAVKRMKKQTGLGMIESKQICMEYHQFLCAKVDFNSGKPVFVPYGGAFSLFDFPS